MRQFYQFIASNERWALTPAAALSLWDTVQMVLDRDVPFDPKLFGIIPKEEYPQPQKITATIIVADAATKSGGRPTSNKKTGVVALIPIKGLLMKDDGLCSYGMATLGKWVMAADEDPEVDAVVLVTDTPGGTVAGTENFARIIANANKPIVSFVEDQSGSAGVWLNSQSDHIMLSGQTTQVGSIGVMISYLDMSRALKEKGYERRLLRSSLSPDKNKYNLDQPTEDDLALIQTEMLDPIAKHFQETVKAGRHDVSEDALTGNMYFAQEAIALGLADSVGSLEDAVSYALDLAHGQENHASKKATQENSTMKTYSEDEFAAIQASHATALEDKDLVIAGLKAQLATKAKLIESQATRIGELEKENEELGDQTASAATEVDMADKVKDPFSGIDQKHVTHWDRKLMEIRQGRK